MRIRKFSQKSFENASLSQYLGILVIHLVFNENVALSGKLWKSLSCFVDNLPKVLENEEPCLREVLGGGCRRSVEFFKNLCDMHWKITICRKISTLMTEFFYFTGKSDFKHFHDFLKGSLNLHDINKPCCRILLVLAITPLRFNLLRKICESL